MLPLYVLVRIRSVFTNRLSPSYTIQAENDCDHIPQVMPAPPSSTPECIPLKVHFYLAHTETQTGGLSSVLVRGKLQTVHFRVPIDVQCTVHFRCTSLMFPYSHLASCRRSHPA